MRLGREAALVVVAAVLAGLVLTAANFVTTAWLAAGVDEAPYRERIATALKDGTIPHGETLQHDTFFNECIVLTSLIAPYPSAAVEMQSLRAFFHSSEGRRLLGCNRLAGYVLADEGEPGLYSRYLNGWRLYYLATMPALPLAQVFALPLCLGYGLLAWGLLRHGRRLRHLTGAPAVDAAARHQELGMLAIFAALLLFFGWETYGYLPTFALPGLVLFAMLLWLGRKPAFARPRWVLYGGLAGFGALTAQLDFLTGPAPLGLAAVLGVLALQLRQPRTEFVPLLAAGAAFTGGFIAAAAVKFGVGYATLGPAWLADTLEQLAYRSGGDFVDEIDIGLLDTLVPGWRRFEAVPGFDVLLFGGKMLWSAGTIGFGSRPIGAAVILLAGVVLVAAMLWLLRKHAQRTAQLLAFLASTFVVALWFVVFFNHGIVHTNMMVRLAVWPIAVALFFVLFWLDMARTWRRADPWAADAPAGAT